MKNWQRALLVFMLALVSGWANAQSVAPDDLQRRQALVAKLLQQAHFDKQYAYMADQIGTSLPFDMEEALQSVLPSEEARREFVSRVTNNFVIAFKKDDIKNKFIEAMTEFWATEFSVEELQYLSDFRASPIAQQILEKKLRQNPFIQEMEQKLTAEELQYLSDFYASPIAQKMVAKMPRQKQLMQEVEQKVGRLLGKKAAELTRQQMDIEIKQWIQEIDQKIGRSISKKAAELTLPQMEMGLDKRQ